MVRLGGRCVLFLALVCATSAQSSNYVTLFDMVAASLARNAKNTYCAGGFRGEAVDRAKARDQLQQATGGTNVVLNVLKKARSPAQTQKALQEEITPNWAVSRSWPLVLGILTIIVWFFCCWTAWPFKWCCRCCRCCVKTRATWLPVKIIGLSWVVGLMIGIAVMTGLAAKGYGKVRDGFINMSCTAGGLLDTSLSGAPATPGPYFVGILPLLDTFSTLDGNLNSGSQMMTDLNAVIGETQTISTAVSVAANTLQVLADTLNADQNKRPGGGSLHHNCTICQALANQALQPAINALNNGVGKALAGAREEMNNQLTPSARAALQATLRASVQPLNQLKDMLVQVFSFFLDTNKFREVQKYIDGDTSPVYGAVIGLIAAAFILLAFAFSSFLSFICCERCDHKVSPGQNPYCRSIHRIACCTWCCSFLYVLAAFIIGGIMYVASAPLGGMCLTLDGVNGQLATELMPAFGQGAAGDTGDMFATLVDRCFTEAAVSQNNNILDIVYTRDSSNNKVTANQKVRVEVKDKIDATFALLESKMSLPSILSNADVDKLLKILRDTPMDAVMMPDNYAWDADANYQALFTTPGKAALALATSTRCEDTTLIAEVPTVGGTLVRGTEYLAESLSDIGTVIDGPPCARTLSCVGVTPATAAACDAAVNYLGLKQRVRDASYRCNLFRRPGTVNGVCDPKDMTKDSGGWINDCMDNGQMTVLERPCNLAEFVNYVKDSELRIRKVFERLETDTNDVKDKIGIRLRGLANTYIISPIGNVTAGVTCGFLARYYRETIDGLCFQAIYGFREVGVSFVVCALLIATLIIVTYALWRRSVDNVNSFVLPQTKE